CQHWLRIWQLAKVFAAPRVAADALRVDEEGAPYVQRTEADHLLAVDAEGTRRLFVPVGEELLAAEQAALLELFRPLLVRGRSVLRERVDLHAQLLELRYRSPEPGDLELSAALVASGEVEDVNVQHRRPLGDELRQADRLTNAPLDGELRDDLPDREIGHRWSVVGAASETKVEAWSSTTAPRQTRAVAPPRSPPELLMSRPAPGSATGPATTSRAPLCLAEGSRSRGTFRRSRSASRPRSPSVRAARAGWHTAFGPIRAAPYPRAPCASRGARSARGGARRRPVRASARRSS